MKIKGTTKLNTYKEDSFKVYFPIAIKEHDL